MRLARRRLEHLYEISTILARFESVVQTFVPILEITMRTLPLRSAILMEAEAGDTRTSAWPEGEHQRVAQENVAAAFDYLVSAAAAPACDLGERNAPCASLRTRGSRANPQTRFIVIPIVVPLRPAFGVLQLEASQTFDKGDLMFVNAITNQFAIALARSRERQQDIALREIAEERRIFAEASVAWAERRRVSAEQSTKRYENLAAENARLYRAAQQAVRVRETVLSIVSHDLRGPLGAILMTADVLASRGEVPQAVVRIRRAANGMRRLIDDLLDFASIDSGRLSIRCQPLDPGPMIEDTLAGLEVVAHARRLQLSATIEPQLPQVYADRERILQVLSNLVANATNVMSEGGSLSLRVEARAHEVVFVVSDNGPGISAHDVEHIFKRYWRSDEAKYRGSGLGLAIANGIVSAHGGRMWVETELGRGATFLFTIPTADTLPFALPGAEDAASSGSDEVTREIDTDRLFGRPSSAKHKTAPGSGATE